MAVNPARAVTYRDLVVSYGPVAYWRLGETSGSTAADETGDYPGTYVGPVLGQQGTVSSDKAAAFDGIDDYVDVGTPSVSGSAITITGWIKADDFDVPDARIISKKKIWTILLVVGNVSSLTTQESNRRSLMQSWGYRVNLIAASDSQANFDAAALNADVAYVPEPISNVSLSTKLKSTPLGVVNEKAELNSTFGFASDYIIKSRTQIRILNNTHYITSGYTLNGFLTIVSSSQSLVLLNSSYAGGLQELGEALNVGSGYKPSLAVINQGGALWGGGTAAGRRVSLPWGGTGFDINALSANGQTIMKRSIEWAAGRDAASSETERHFWTLGTSVSGGNAYLNVLLKSGSSTASLTATSGALVTGEWTFAAAVYNGSTLKLYKNGVEVASTSRTGSVPTGSNVPAWIGSQPEGAAGASARPFDGILDEIAIFGRALTPAELLELNRVGSLRGVRIVKWTEIQ